MPKFSVLIIEDEKNIQTFMGKVLKRHDYQVLYADTGKQGLEMIRSRCPDLILLDLGLPDMDGCSIIRDVRTWASTPIIVISARTAEREKVAALDLGADDYIMKPFDSKEMVARVKAVLRRYQPGQKMESPVEDKSKRVEYPGISINLTNYSVIVDGQTVDMPPKELELLYFLAASPNQVFTREQLLDQIWGYEYIGDTRTVDVHIKRLREKIKDHATWGLATVWFIVYKFEVK